MSAGGNRAAGDEVVTWKVAMRVLESLRNSKLDKQPRDGDKSNLQQVGVRGGVKNTLVHRKSRERQSVELDALHHHPRISMDWTTRWSGQLSDPTVRVVRVMRQLVHAKRIAFLALPGRRTHGREWDGASLARGGQVKVSQAQGHPGRRRRRPAGTLLCRARRVRFAAGIRSGGALRGWCGATRGERPGAVPFAA